MSVYVDHLLPCLPNKNWHWNHSAHLFADTVAELHTFAARLGLKRIWFQDEGFLPHYDLTTNKHGKAVTLGAVLLTREKATMPTITQNQADAANRVVQQRGVIPHWSRAWAMPTLATFDCRPIKSFVLKYLMHSILSVDPFARNQALATLRNDMDPSTTAEHHMPAVDFLDMLVKQGVTADLVLFDPPYSPRQIKECYNGIGIRATQGHTQGVRCKRERELVARMQNIGGIVLSFGWNSTGMGKGLGYELIEGLLVNHGGAHNDTICTAERKVSARMVRDKRSS